VICGPGNQVVYVNLSRHKQTNKHLKRVAMIQKLDRMIEVEAQKMEAKHRIGDVKFY